MSEEHENDEDENLLSFSSTITVRKSYDLPIPVNIEGSIISYRFRTEPGDISFGISFKNIDGRESILKELDRVPSHIGSATGTVTLPDTTGVVFLKWDNLFSWFTTKELTYSVELRHVRIIAYHR